MRKLAYRWSIVFLVMSSVLWTSASQAFFCFSMGGGGRHRDVHYPVLPPYGGFGDAGLSAFPYNSPVMPQPPVTPIAPIETWNVDYPARAEPVPKQHIFH
jgi:hypothetical protein